MTSVLHEFKEYIQKTYGINARYKGYAMEINGSEKYQEQNTIIIYPESINYTNSLSNGIMAVEFTGELSIYMTEERLRENFLFEKIYMHADGKRLILNSTFNISHWNEEVLEVSVAFTYLTHYEFDREVISDLKIDNEIIINKKEG